MDNKSQEILTFIVENQRFALDLQVVDKAIRAVAITKLSETPAFIEGVIDYYGEVIAVINLRKRLGFPIVDLRVSDRFLIVKTEKQKIALIVDEVEKLFVPNDNDIFDSKNLDAGMQFIKLVREDEGIILIYDIESLLNKAEEIELAKFIESNKTSPETI